MASKSVRADTPDPTKYHPNRGGMPGTMIPRAGKDGESLGFDPNRPATVIVDPGETGGGFTLDMSALTRVKKNFNSAAVRPDVASDVTSFYRELSERMKEKVEPEAPTKKELPVTEPLKPLSALPPLNPLPLSPVAPISAPATLPDGITNPEELSREIEKLLSADAVKAAAIRERLLGRVTVSEPVIEPKPQIEEPGMRNLINALVARVNQLTMDQAIVSESRNKLVQAPVEKEELKPDNLELVFEKLQIPFFTGPTAIRPQYETYFEMAKMGTMAARYHAVIAGQDCLALIYDTRFEDGFQYLPPNLGDEIITVSVPKLKANYRCSSLGLHWTLGCLDVVILIRQEGEQQ